MIKIREQITTYKNAVDNWIHKNNKSQNEIEFWTNVWNDLLKYNQFLCDFGSCRVYIIDGAYIRNNVCLDFCVGANFCRYPWMPENTLGVERILPSGMDRNAIIIHEYSEIKAMMEGMSYDDAHSKIANKEEDTYRQNPKNSKYYDELVKAGLE